MRSDRSPTPAPDSTRRDASLSAPPPKTARGVKIVLAVAMALFGLIALSIWALVRAFAS
jgi:hypothetical protein